MQSLGGSKRSRKLRVLPHSRGQRGRVGHSFWLQRAEGWAIEACAVGAHVIHGRTERLNGDVCAMACRGPDRARRSRVNRTGCAALSTLPGALADAAAVANLCVQTHCCTLALRGRVIMRRRDETLQHCHRLACAAATYVPACPSWTCRHFGHWSWLSGATKRTA
jgi:hypothetical protein